MRKQAVRLPSMSTLSPPKPTLGPSQIHALSTLKENPTGLTAPALRDALDLPQNDYGTRRVHAITGRLVELGFVTKEEMSAKVALNNVHKASGRKSKHRFKINSDGKKALKSAS